MLTDIFLMCPFPLQHTHRDSFSHYSLLSFPLIISQTPWIAPARLSTALGFRSTLGACLKHLLAGCFPPVITLGRREGMREPAYHRYRLQTLNRAVTYPGCSAMAKLSHHKKGYKILTGVSLYNKIAYARYNLVPRSCYCLSFMQL